MEPEVLSVIVSGGYGNFCGIHGYRLIKIWDLKVGSDIAHSVGHFSKNTGIERHQS